MTGKVILVGAGPGDPELVTVKALNAIRRADVLLYDRLVSTELLHYCRPECEQIYVGKAHSNHSMRQDQINELLLLHARRGGVVVRLKGGDPFLFGRGAEEARHLAQHEIPFEVIPGVTSALAVPASASIPVTCRGVSASCAFITGHPARGEPDRIPYASLAGIGTVVFLMGVSTRRRIARKLIEAGRPADDPVAFIMNGTTDDEQVLTTTLGEVAADPPPVRPPAIFIVGPVVGVREELEAFRTRCPRPIIETLAELSASAPDPAAVPQAG